MSGIMSLVSSLAFAVLALIFSVLGIANGVRKFTLHSLMTHMNYMYHNLHACKILRCTRTRPVNDMLLFNACSHAQTVTAAVMHAQKMNPQAF